MTPHPPSAAPWPAHDGAVIAARTSDAALLAGVRQHPAVLQKRYVRYCPVVVARAARTLAEPAPAATCAATVFLHLWPQPLPAHLVFGDTRDWALAAALRRQVPQGRRVCPDSPPFLY